MRIGGHNKRAFSLVEVVVAIGIISFALLTILGLMSIGMHSGATSRTDTALALLSDNCVAQLRMTPFTNLSPGNVGTYYFDSAGNSGNTNTNPSFSPFYRCTVSATGDPATSSGSTNNFFSVNLSIAWPPPSYANTNNIQTSFANY